MDDELLKKVLGEYFKEQIDEKTDMNQLADKADVLSDKWAKLNCVIDELLADAYDYSQYGGGTIGFNEIKERAKELFGLELTDDEIEIECEDRIASDPFLLDYDIDEWDDKNLGKFFDVTLGWGRVMGGLDWHEEEDFEYNLYNKEMELYEHFKEKYPMSYNQESHTLTLPNGKTEANVYTYKQAKKLYDDMACDTVNQSKEYKKFEKMEEIKRYNEKLNNEYNVNVTDIASKYRLLATLKLDCNHYIEAEENNEPDSKRWLVEESVDRHFNLISDLIKSLPDGKVPNGFDNETLNDLKGKVQWSEYCKAIDVFVGHYDTFMRDWDLSNWSDYDLDEAQEYEKLRLQQVQDLKDGNAQEMVNTLNAIKEECFKMGDYWEDDDYYREDIENIDKLLNEYETLDNKRILFMNTKEFVQWLNEETPSLEEQQEEDDLSL